MKEYVNDKKIVAKRVSLNTKSIKIIKNGIVFMKYASIPAIGIAAVSATAIALSDVDTKANNEVKHVDWPTYSTNPVMTESTDEIAPVEEEFNLEQYKNIKTYEIETYCNDECFKNNYNNQVSDSILNIKASFVEAIRTADSKETIDDFYARCFDNIDYNINLNQTLIDLNQQYVTEYQDKLTQFASQFENFNYDEYNRLNESKLRWYKSYETNNYMYYCSETGIQVIEINDVDHNGYESFRVGMPDHENSSKHNIQIGDFEECSVTFHLMPENERRSYDKRELNPCSYEEMIEMGIELNKGIVK